MNANQSRTRDLADLKKPIQEDLLQTWLKANERIKTDRSGYATRCPWPGMEHFLHQLCRTAGVSGTEHL